jgi:hypothetical protein
MKSWITFVCALTLPAVFTGCASIVDGGPKTVQINSKPEGAKVTITNRAGKEVCVQTTPATVILERSAGFFEAENYTLHFQATGYYPYETHVQSAMDGWYLANAFFGGLIGMLIVDPATGAMFTLSPRTVDCTLTPVDPPLAPSQSVGPETNSPAPNASSSSAQQH